MTVHDGSLHLDAEALYRELLRGVRQICSASTRLVGITSGGAWLAERLQQDLQLPGQPGKISSAMHRDDFAQRGLSSGGQTVLPFDVKGAHILVLDDVLFTGRTSHAAVVARQLGKVCLVACPGLEIDLGRRQCRGGETLFNEGDFISLDGSLGQVYLGKLSTIESTLSGDFATLMKWADETRTMKVRTNGDTPHDAEAARRRYMKVDPDNRLVADTLEADWNDKLRV